MLGVFPMYLLLEAGLVPIVLGLVPNSRLPLLLLHGIVPNRRHPIRRRSW